MKNKLIIFASISALAFIFYMLYSKNTESIKTTESTKNTESKEIIENKQVFVNDKNETIKFINPNLNKEQQNAVVKAMKLWFMNPDVKGKLNEKGIRVDVQEWIDKEYSPSGKYGEYSSVPEFKLTAEQNARAMQAKLNIEDITRKAVDERSLQFNTALKCESFLESKIDRDEYDFKYDSFKELYPRTYNTFARKEHERKLDSAFGSRILPSYGDECNKKFKNGLITREEYDKCRKGFGSCEFPVSEEARQKLADIVHQEKNKADDSEKF